MNPHELVLQDLRDHRQRLMQQVVELDSAIAVITRLHSPAPPANGKSLMSDVVVLGEAPLLDPLPPPTRPAIALPRPATPPEKPIPTLGTRPPAPIDPSQNTERPGLTDTILALASESKYNQEEVIQRVMLRRSCTRQQAYAGVWALLRNQRINKGTDLLIRRIVGGKIQGLPAPGPEENISWFSSLSR